MVRALRESLLGQIFLGAIVVAIIAAFALSGTTAGAPGVASDCAVEVGGHCVSPKEFQASYGLVTSIGIREQAAERLNLRKQVARGLAEREVLVQRARELGIATSKKDVDAELAEGRARVSLPADGAERLALSLALCVEGPSGCAPGSIGVRSLPVKTDGVFDYERYKRTVRVATGRSPGHFKEAQQREHTAERLRDFIRSQVKVSEEEAFLAYRRARSQATARIARVPQSWFSRYVVELSNEEVDEWAADNEQAVDDAVKALKEGWEVGCPIVSEIRLSPGAATSAEDETASSPSARLAEVRRQVRSGKSFSLLARRLSQADSANLGGFVGCLDETYGPNHDALLAEIGELEEGALSPVIDTAEGPTLVRLEGRVTEGNREDELRSFVARQLATEEAARTAAREFAGELIERLEGGAPIVKATEELTTEALARGPLEEEESPGASAENRPTTDISRPFTIAQSPLSDAAPDVLAAKLVFDLEEADDVVQEPVEIEDGVAVLQLKEKDMATREDFAEDRDQVLTQLRSRKAEEALAAFVAKLIEKGGGVRYDETFVPPPEENGEKGEEVPPTGS